MIPLGLGPCWQVAEDVLPISRIARANQLSASYL